MVLEKTISMLFDPKTRILAQTLLTEIRNRQDTDNPYKADEYQEFCKKHGFSQNQYYTILSKLRDVGIVRKYGGHHEGAYAINSHFILQLLKEWLEFLGAEYGEPT
jgi:Cdc6-like AAA superfamily ATPase